MLTAHIAQWLVTISETEFKGVRQQHPRQQSAAVTTYAPDHLQDCARSAGCCSANERRFDCFSCAKRTWEEKVALGGADGEGFYLNKHGGHFHWLPHMALYRVNALSLCNWHSCELVSVNNVMSDMNGNTQRRDENSKIINSLFSHIFHSDNLIKMIRNANIATNIKTNTATLVFLLSGFVIWGIWLLVVSKICYWRLKMSFFRKSLHDIITEF